MNKGVEGTGRSVGVMTMLIAILLIAIVIVLVVAKVNSPGNPWHAGEGCYEDAAMAALVAYTTAETTIIAGGGARTVDRLGARALASALELPILLTGPEVLPSETVAAISRLNAKKAYVLGDTDSVSDAAIGELMERGLFVKRISGDNCCDTAARIAAEVGKDQEFRIRFFKKVPSIITDSFRRSR